MRSSRQRSAARSVSPNAAFELIPDAGHLPQLAQPAAMFAAIDKWVDVTR
jgi:pimeloyl-ACP methyl ester carboxylesterase